MELNFNLSNAVKRALDDMKFETLTEIQQKAIPHILEGRDVIGKSQTGSGKTLAFGIPAVMKVDPDMNRKITQVLVLCPTRELAVQACGEIRKVAKYTRGSKIVAVYGGQEIGKQIPMVRSGAQVVVGTPGRVMDLINRKVLKLGGLKMIVLDEADEMLNMGFREDVETILKAVPDERQTLLFSATMPKEILDIVENYQQDPVLVESEKKQPTVETIKQYCVDCPKGMKTDAMLKLMEAYEINTAIVFCNTKKMVDMLSETLQQREIAAKGLHGDMKQRDRDRVMNSFRKGKTKILIATDVAARGIDVKGVDCVFNYDIPNQTEYYVHRIGRTGRAGKSGIAFTLSQGKGQAADLAAIVKATKSKVELIEKDELGLSVPSREKPASAKREKKKADMARAFEMAEKRKPKREAKKEGAKRGNTEDMYPVRISIGRKNNVSPKHIVGAVAGESGIKGSEIGHIRIGDDHTTVEVPVKYKEIVLKTVNGTKIRGKKISAK